jgi:hypothetical protein
MPSFIEIVAPSFLASYWINGDETGITPEEKEEADDFTEMNNVRIISTKDDEEESFGMFPHPWNVSGNVITYIAEEMI